MMGLGALNIAIALVLIVISWAIGYVCGYEAAENEDGGRPVSEIPTWAWWLLQSKGGK